MLNAGDLIVRKGSDREELAIDDSGTEIIGQIQKKLLASF